MLMFGLSCRLLLTKAHCSPYTLSVATIKLDRGKPVRLSARSLVFLLIASSAVLPLHSQVDTASKLKFDVVSVRRDNSGSENIRIFSPTEGDGLTLNNVTLLDVIAYSYNIQSANRLSGLPDWAKSERYDIQAKVADNDVAVFRQTQEPGRKEMIQQLLAQSFMMKSHTEPKEISIYALVVAKGGSKMKDAKADSTQAVADGKTLHEPGLNGYGPGKMAGYQISMKEFAPALSGMAGRQVVNQTGLASIYDFTLDWTPDNSPASETTGPSLFTALEEQLGLKLEPQKITMPVLVVDSLTRAEN